MKSLLDEDWVGLCDNLWEVLTGLILDTRTPLERLYKSVSFLKDKNLLDFRNLQKYSIEQIAGILKDAGYIWYNQKAKFLKQEVNFDLENSCYEDILSLNGVGPKLASLWMAIVWNSNDYPVIDVHVKQYLKTKGYDYKDYDSLASAFKQEAAKENMTVLELDKKVLEEGIRRRRGF